MARLVVDTGFLVALYRRSDSLHQSALGFLRESRAALLTVGPVVVETCHFLGVRGRAELLRWVGRRGLAVADVPTEAYAVLAASIEKYADLDLDLADAALVWLAEHTGERKLLTVDERDFAAIRLTGRKRFELVPWYRARGHGAV